MITHDNDNLDYHEDSRVPEADDKLVHYYSKLMNPSFDEMEQYEKAELLNEVLRLTRARSRRGIKQTEDFKNKWG